MPAGMLPVGMMPPAAAGAGAAGGAGPGMPGGRGPDNPGGRATASHSGSSSSTLRVTKCPGYNHEAAAGRKGGHQGQAEQAVSTRFSPFQHAGIACTSANRAPGMPGLSTSSLDMLAVDSFTCTLVLRTTHPLT
jgi:hypothetical protein